MSSKVLGIAAVAIGCVAAAGTGAYVAVRQNAAPASALSTIPSEAAPSATRPVSETEALVERAPDSAPPAAASPAPLQEPQPEPASQKSTPRPAARREPTEARRRTEPADAPATPVATTSAPPAAPSAGTERGTSVLDAVPPGAGAVETPAAESPRMPEPPPPPQPELEEVVVPASAVIGLQVDTPLSSERARVEDRVEARVTRDVLSAGRVAIPAGSRVYGSVTVVERGGKVKEKARLGVRFHTLVLADGIEMPLRTEAIYRDGESPSGESARKIGGAAIGGAIIGAIIGGGKGAATGGAIGAAGGTAAVMAGDRNAATLPAGTILTVRLLAPLAIEVPRTH